MKKNALFAHSGGARDKLLRLSFLGTGGERGGAGFFFFTTKQLSGVCQLIGTRSTIIILLLRMNESSVAVFFLFFFFTGIRDENGWRIDNETRARSRNYEPDSGGSEIIVCNLNRETRRFGWNVSVEICLIRLIIHTRLITRFKNNSMGTYHTITTIAVYTYHPRVIIYHIIKILNARVYGTVCNDVMLYSIRLEWLLCTFLRLYYNNIMIMILE